MLLEIERPPSEPGNLRLTVTLSAKLKAALVGIRGRSTEAGHYEDRAPETPGYTPENPTERLRSFRVLALPGFPFNPDSSIPGRLAALLAWTGWRDLPDECRTVSIKWRTNRATAEETKRNMETAIASIRAWIQATLLAWKVTFQVTTEAL